MALDSHRDGMRILLWLWAMCFGESQTTSCRTQNAVYDGGPRTRFAKKKKARQGRFTKTSVVCSKTGKTNPSAGPTDNSGQVCNRMHAIVFPFPCKKKKKARTSEAHQGAGRTKEETKKKKKVRRKKEREREREKKGKKKREKKRGISSFSSSWALRDIRATRGTRAAAWAVWAGSVAWGRP